MKRIEWRVGQYATTGCVNRLRVFSIQRSLTREDPLPNIVVHSLPGMKTRVGFATLEEAQDFAERVLDRFVARVGAVWPDGTDSSSGAESKAASPAPAAASSDASAPTSQGEEK